MPFGSIFGAIVFGLIGPVLGMRIASGQPVPMKVMGACLALAGVTIAAGLLMKRAWARWLGVVVGFAFAGFALISPDDVLHLTMMLAAAAAATLLLVPATGKPQLQTAAGPAAPSRVSRAFFGLSLVGLVGFVGAAPLALFGKLAPATSPAAASATDSRQSDARRREPDAAPAPSGPVTWHHFAEGMKQAKSDGKLMVVDFYATWCGPCKTMEKRTFKDPRVLKRLHDVVPVRVDAEEVVPRGGPTGEDLALRYGVEVYPTIVVIDGSGREVARNAGALGPEQFLDWIDSVLERAGTSLARS